jgi:hypothetical protein
MGKLSLKQAQDLLDNQIIDQETFDEMQKSNMISQGRGNAKRYIKAADGTWVVPRLYFGGLKNGAYSDKMLKLKNEINTVIEKYTEGEIR